MLLNKELAAFRSSSGALSKPRVLRQSGSSTYAFLTAVTSKNMAGNPFFQDLQSPAPPVEDVATQAMPP